MLDLSAAGQAGPLPHPLGGEVGGEGEADETRFPELGFKRASARTGRA
jgi:hypothetical protein